MYRSSDLVALCNRTLHRALQPAETISTHFDSETDMYILIIGTVLVVCAACLMALVIRAPKIDTDYSDHLINGRR